MLAALATRPGQLLSADALIEALWGDRAPRTAPHALHVHASRLRKLLPAELEIVGTAAGYVMRLGPEQLDVDRFEDLAARGRAELSSGDAAAATTILRSALRLWRGHALADVPAERFAEADVQRWEELRRVTEEDLVDAELAAGNHARVIADLETLVNEQPFRERRWGQLMVALYRAGRQADALDRYRHVRTLLAEELGLDPSPTLRRLEGMILRQDDALAVEPVTGDAPVTRFAHGPAGRLAYQVLGAGPENLVFVPGFGGNVEIRWEQPNLARLYRRLASATRLVLFDKRGTGLSDRDTGIPTVEEQVDDVLAVMDAAGVERAALLGVMDGGTIALLAAAARPDRIRAVATYACFSAYELLGAGAGEMFESLRSQVDRGCLRGRHADTRSDPRRRSLVRPLVRPLHAHGRWSRGAAALLDRFQQIDIRAALPMVSVPVLAIHRQGDRLIPSVNASYIASHVQDGQAVILPGDDSVIWAGDVDAIAAEVELLLLAMSSPSGESRNAIRSREEDDPMFRTTKAFSGFAVNDIDAAKKFYGEVLGIDVTEEHGLLNLHLAGGRDTLAYPEVRPRTGDVHDPQLPRARTSTPRSTS